MVYRVVYDVRYASLYRKVLETTTVNGHWLVRFLLFGLQRMRQDQIERRLSQISRRVFLLYFRPYVLHWLAVQQCLGRAYCLRPASYLRFTMAARI
jgi:hypothetical protein